MDKSFIGTIDLDYMISLQNLNSFPNLNQTSSLNQISSCVLHVGHYSKITSASIVHESLDLAYVEQHDLRIKALHNTYLSSMTSVSYLSYR